MSGSDAGVDVDGRTIGPGQPTYIVAELSANHGGSYERAAELVRVAKAAGADAVKLQTYTPDTLTLRNGGERFRISAAGPWKGRDLYELYSEAQMPWEWQPRLRALAAEIGLPLFSSAFDPTSVEFLERMGVPAYKVASFELVDLPLIELIARTGKPMILSTGMASEEEIASAIAAARAGGARSLVLLKCTSAYPAPAEEMNLRSIPYLAGRFGLPVGLSDHTDGHLVAAAAVALGAVMVEKHLILSRDLGGPDAGFSLEPDEFARLATAIRTVERALGSARCAPGPSDAPNRVLRRSLFVVADIRRGERFSPANLRSIRPADGLEPRHLPQILGRRATRDLPRGTPLSWDLVENAESE
jgi:N-acetylneuraminate synthase